MEKIKDRFEIEKYVQPVKTQPKTENIFAVITNKVLVEKTDPNKGNKSSKKRVVIELEYQDSNLKPILSETSVKIQKKFDAEIQNPRKVFKNVLKNTKYSKSHSEKPKIIKFETQKSFIQRKLETVRIKARIDTSTNTLPDFINDNDYMNDELTKHFASIKKIRSQSKRSKYLPGKTSKELTTMQSKEKEQPFQHMHSVVTSPDHVVPKTSSTKNPVLPIFQSTTKTESIRIILKNQIYESETERYSERYTKPPVKSETLSINVNKTSNKHLSNDEKLAKTDANHTFSLKQYESADILISYYSNSVTKETVQFLYHFESMSQTYDLEKNNESATKVFTKDLVESQNETMQTTMIVSDSDILETMYTTTDSSQENLQNSQSDTETTVDSTTSINTMEDKEFLGTVRNETGDESKNQSDVLNLTEGYSSRVNPENNEIPETPDTLNQIESETQDMTTSIEQDSEVSNTSDQNRLEIEIKETSSDVESMKTNTIYENEWIDENKIEKEETTVDITPTENNVEATFKSSESLSPV